jgi:hypothetical protein
MLRKTIKLLLLSISALFLISCGKSNVTLVENNQIRSSNCSLVESFIQYTNSPSYRESSGNKNTYDFRAEEELLLWGELQQGDESFEKILELRKVSYAQDWWAPPVPIGNAHTEENEENVVRLNENPFSDDQQWSIIREVSKVCTNVTDTELAEEFAFALLIEPNDGTN